MAAALALILAASLASVAALAGPASARQDGPANKLSVTFSIFPDPWHSFSFYTIPRTLHEAIDSEFELTGARSTSTLGVLVYCRKNDYRVCPLYDVQGSVAGIMVSVAKSEFEKSKVPIDIENDEFWYKQKVGDVDVYSTATFFVSGGILGSGGRPIDDNTPTAPDGLYIHRTGGLLHVGGDEKQALQNDFHKQACFRGMGLHYFQGLTKTSQCEENKPYFMLFDPQTKQLNGFGITQFGKVSQGRGWFETPPALIVKKIAPDSPPCLTEWTKKYGIFTIHVFFVDKPWKTRC